MEAREGVEHEPFALLEACEAGLSDPLGRQAIEGVTPEETGELAREVAAEVTHGGTDLVEEPADLCALCSAEVQLAEEPPGAAPAPASMRMAVSPMTTTAPHEQTEDEDTQEESGREEGDERQHHGRKQIDERHEEPPRVG